MTDWTESPRLRCLGFNWTVAADDPALVRHVTSLYEPCLAPGTARHRFTLHNIEKNTTGAACLSLARDGVVVLRDATPALAVAQLAWEVNRGVVEDTADRLLLHAAAAALDGEVVVISGSGGAGKSTLVTALVRSGWRYVTDEALAVEPANATIDPYPKPIALERGSWALFPDLDLGSCAEAGFASTDELLVAPGTIRAHAMAGPVGAAALVLFPTLRPGHPPAVREVGRAEATTTLARQSFNFETFGSGALDVLAEVVRTSRCYRLDVADLDATCDLVLELFDRTPTRP